MLFLSTFQNKLDKKGRVSVPSSFRNVITRLNSEFNGIICYSSFINDCVEACSYEQIERISNIIDQLDPYSEHRDAFATSILASSVNLPFDNEGRVILTEDLIERACLDDLVCFVGKGKNFEIWNPEKFKENKEISRKLALESRGILQVQKGGL